MRSPESTAQNRTEVLLRLPELAEGLSDLEYLQLGMKFAEDLTGSRIAFAHYVASDGQTIELTGGWSERTLKGCTAVYDRHYPVPEAGIWADAVRKKRPVVFNDYPAYTDKRGLPEGHTDLLRLITVPVVQRGKVRMVAGVGNKDVEYTVTDVETVQLLFNSIWQVLAWRREREAVRASEAFLRQVGRQAKVGGWSLDAETLRVQWTDEVYHIHGLPVGSPVELRPGFDFFHPDDRPILDGAIERAFKEAEPYDIELRMTSAAGEKKWTRAICEPQVVGGKVVRLVGAFQDITVQKKAALRLEETARTLELALATARLGVWRRSPDGRLDWDEGQLEIYGLDRASFDGTLEHWKKLIHPDDLKRVEEQIEVLWDGDLLSELEFRIVRPDGEVRHIVATGAPMMGEEGELTGLVGVNRDITRQKNAEARLRRAAEGHRALARRLTHVREEERGSLARELHDELGQLLTAARMDLSIAQSALRDEDRQMLALERLRALDGLLDQGVAMVQDLSARIRSPVLEVLGFVPAVREHLGDFSGRSGLSCALDADEGKVTVSGTVATTAFRIVQESLTNVARHAKASKVQVTVLEAEGYLTLRVEDDGVGMDPEEGEAAISLGLMGMRERAAAVGGTVTVGGRPGGGTLVKAVLPLSPREGATPM